MFKRTPRLLAAAILAASPVAFAQVPPAPPAAQQPPRHMENLGRGVIALNEGGGKVFISWRVLGTDPDTLGFNLYRKEGDAAPIRLNREPILGATNFVDNGVKLEAATQYFVRTVENGVEQAASKPWTLPANAPVRDYLEIPVKTPQGFSPNDCSVGDLDGDGEYEIIVHMTGRGIDNPSAGVSDQPVLQAYKLDGTFLWSINLGKNIREGAHYTQFMVADFDGDGKAEMICKTADGTTDGKGKVVGDPQANWVNAQGFIQTGPEFLTVFNGLTGEAMATVPYVPDRGNGNAWGGVGGNGNNDNGNNRRDRFTACVAWLDGVHPSAVMCRGYYGRSVLAAWDWDGKKLSQRWVFDSADNPNGGAPYLTEKATVDPAVGLKKITDNAGKWLGVLPGDWLCWDEYAKKEYRQVKAVEGNVLTVDEDMTPGVDKGVWVAGYSGQGAHGISCGDVNGDGKDDIVFHAMVVNSDGKGLFTTGLRHGDALHFGKLDPDLPGLQVFGIHENEGSAFDAWTPASACYDAATGKVLWRTGDDQDAGRGLSADIDPRYPGEEMWGGPGGLKTCKGQPIGNQPSTQNFAVWWDGDDLRELLDANRIMKWNYQTAQTSNILVAQSCTSNNSSKSTPGLCADILGDWREEVIWRTTNNQALRIYSTTIPTQRRLYTLMHDPIYRNSVAWQNVAYNQPTHTGFYLGNGMKTPPKPNIVLVKPKETP